MRGTDCVFREGQSVSLGPNDYSLSFQHLLMPQLSEELNKRLRPVINAMINQNGGQIYIGLGERFEVRGTLLNGKTKDKIRLFLDTTLSLFVPQVDSDLQVIEFYAVEVDDEYVCRDSQVRYDQGSHQFVDCLLGKPLELCVVKISIRQGTAPVYYCGVSHDVAYSFLAGEVVKLTMEQIVDRVANGRPVGYIEEGGQLDFTFREEIITQCLDFFAKETTSTKVVSLYGRDQAGKSKLAEHIRQQLFQNKLFTDGRSIYIDLKGVSQKHLDLNAALVQMIRSINPMQELSFVQQAIETHCSLLSISADPPNQAPEESSSTMQQYGLSSVPFDQLTETLLNVYLNLAFDKAPLLITLENVGGCRFYPQLIPSGAECCVIMTSHQLLNIELELDGPAVSTLEVQVKPLSHQASCQLIRRLINADDKSAAELATICNGIPQYIITLCNRGKMFGLTAFQLLEQFRQMQPLTIMQYVQPTLVKILQTLRPEHLDVLTALSLFPGMFQSQIAYGVLSTGLKDPLCMDSFMALVKMNLIDLTDSPCTTLRHLQWWYIGETVRKYAFFQYKPSQTLQVLNAYVALHVDFVEQLSAQFTDPNFKKQRNLESQQLRQAILDQFIVQVKNYELSLQIITAMLADHRLDVRNFGMVRGMVVSRSALAFAHLFTRRLLELFDGISVQIMRQQSFSPRCTDAEADAQLWQDAFF